MSRHLSMLAAAALMFMQGGATREALDKAAPADKFSRRQRQKVVSVARTNVMRYSLEQQVINKMTNWQRSQWDRAGRPMTAEGLKHFVELPHWKKSRSA